MDHKTAAHQMARHKFGCVTCDRDLTNAKYEGEFEYPLTIVYLRCRCGSINEITLNLNDDSGFTDVVTDIQQVPRQAMKISKVPAMAEFQE